MRLLSCYISGFGKFSNQTFDLSKDVVEIKADNGWGKTTLAAFIENMLFGMDASRSKQIEDNARLKYEPFGGGAFGGSLTFSHGGNTYRIERTFGKTPSGDTVKLYDKNNLPSLAFGERVDNLGELLLGVNKESYHKSAYLPQGEISQMGFPEDTKARLISLLSVDGNKENGAQTAISRLNQAEGELRSKRAPKHGLLDKIDERLQSLEQEKYACRQAGANMQALQVEISSLQQKLQAAEIKLQGLNNERDKYAEGSERAANRARRQEIERQLIQTEERLDRMQVFFGKIDPRTVNLSGIQTAVQEYYQLQGRLQQSQPQTAELARLQGERAALQARLLACQQTLDSFERMLDEQNKEAYKTYRKSQRLEKKASKKDFRTYIIIIALVLTIWGAIWVQTLPVVGWPILALGGGAIGYFFIKQLLATRFWAMPRKRRSFDDAELNDRYKTAQKEYAELQAALAEYPVMDRAAFENEQQRELAECRMHALQTAIEEFLRNFAFEEVYDYRAALALLQDKCDAYEETFAQREEYVKQCDEVPLLPQEGALSDAYAPVDLAEIKNRIISLEQEKNDLQNNLAQKRAEATAWETRAFALAECKAEEERLSQEKQRLEKKLLAIQTARTLLERARENMTARYLEPVEKTVREYLQTLTADGAVSLRFAADGTPLLDDRGALREVAYYSTGTKELIGFCTRMALIQAMYTKTIPVLILDDPFVNFDDKTTALCKRLVQKLSKTYQIIYCTCKEERRLNK